MKTLFFDLDGTLTDPKEGITNCFKYAFEKLGIPSPPMSELITFIGPPLKKNFGAVLARHGSDQVAEAIDLYRERFGTVGLFENVPYAGIVESLTTLTQNYRCLVVTAKPTLYAKQIVDHFDLTRFFQKVYGSEMDGTNTDKRDLIAHVLASERLNGKDAIMIGDRDMDMAGARHNQVLGLGVLWGYGSREELVNAGATMLTDKPKNLPDDIAAVTE